MCICQREIASIAPKDGVMTAAIEMYDSPLWGEAISKYLKDAKKLHALTYKQLSVRLSAMGIEQTAGNLSTKFNRGTISSQLFCACLIAMNERTINLEDIAKTIDK